ncbi:DUF302 domain-containing protein [Fluoribacter dumoffii]|uniref:DUF302 domain-containing protein n=1 Tax=Fluoribacter dumoffii TaxID=463 RepID=UPI00026C7A5D|nr:DUF302 domain-containing protein [Fluoribacter dumoffii]MCW8386223.1 DUF302 domain-containing protein [Fluoribacter dumoffii]MCW8419274.1 DUF302 domain-containing protein [Fluoribacter dumoffii]MCW8452851.1 DUF302 domain-containing protein [Fluoribacter dumoffii]MCW8459899.1 DUF302 domain-containing protein [Fluoribacter dumoffii]MCW8483376.1 DUF302 domain-containing protein [Fluoribacter dumoffii]
MQNAYGFGTVVNYSFEQALEQIAQELKKEGFGILTEIDVSATMKKKLNKDIPPYRILGACNPELAHKALEADPSIGLLLPCNVVVRQDDAKQVHIEFMDPDAVLQLVNKPEIKHLAQEVKARLQRVLDRI